MVLLSGAEVWLFASILLVRFSFDEIWAMAIIQSYMEYWYFIQVIVTLMDSEDIRSIVL